MGICVFKSDDIRRCVDHALAHPGPTGPFLYFVHDQGVYLMSGGQPPDLVGLPPTPEEVDAFVADTDPQAYEKLVDRLLASPRSYVAYAEGCNPDSGAPFDEWYGRSRELVGGDDFAEKLEIAEDWRDACDKYAECHVEVNPDTMGVSFEKLRRQSKKPINNP